MKRNTYRVISVLLAAVLMLSLAACGKNDAGSGGSAEPTQQPQNTTQIETASGETLTVTEPVAADSYDTVYAAFAAVRENAARLESAEQFSQQEELQINSEAEELGDPDYAAALPAQAGVQRGDLIVQDGSRIYMVSGGELVIVEAAGAETRELGRAFVIGTAPEGYSGSESPCAVYAAGSRLYLVTYESLFRAQEVDGSYTYESVEKVHLKCYDVSDPAAPTIVSDFAQSGQYLNSMLADGKIYLISACSVWAPDAATPSTFVPMVTRNGEDALLEPGDITICPGLDSTDYTVVSVVDTASGADLSTKALTGYHAWSASDGANLYLARTAYDYTESEPYDEAQYSVTDHSYHAFTRVVSLTMDGTLALTASAAVEGALYGNGAIAAAGGELYLATSKNGYTYQLFTDETYGFVNTRIQEQASGNAVYVLDSALSLQRSLQDLGGEAPVYMIYFAGTDACVLGYESLSPVCAVNMAAETLKAEKVADPMERGLYGFGDGLAAGVGIVRDGTGLITGLQLTMYDTTAAPPRAVGAIAAGESWSTALNMTAAVRVLQDAGVIAVPTETGYRLFTWQGETWSETGTVELGYVSNGTRVFRIGDSWYFCNDAMIYVAGSDFAEQAKVEFAYG